MQPSNLTPPNEFSSFGEMLKFLRKRDHLTQAALALAVGYSREQITHLESGRRRPDPTMIAALFVPALHLEHESTLAAHLLSLATQINPSGNALRAKTPKQSSIIDNPDQAKVRAKHRLAAEAAEFAQGDLIEAARHYYLAHDYKAATDVLFDQGQLISSQGRAQEAVAVLDEILPTLRRLEAVNDQAEILRRLLTVRGDLVLNTVRADEADINYREALTLASGAVRTTLIYRLALSLTQRGQASEALAMVQRAYLDIPPQHLLLRVQLKIAEGNALVALARFDEAEKAYLEALALGEQIAPAMPFIITGIRARAHNGLGTINAIQHHPAVALEHWKQAIETAHLAGLRALEYRCQGNIANVQYETGDLVGALSACEAAIDGLRGLGDLHGMAHFLHLRANLSYMRGEIEASLTLVEEACAVKRQLGEQRSLLVSLGQQIKSLLGLNRLDEARNVFTQGMTEVDVLGDDRLRGYWLILSCELSLLSGDYEHAKEAVRSATALSITSQEVKLQGDCCNHLAMATLVTGDVEAASNIFSASASTDIPEIEFERDLIRGLLDWIRGGTPALIKGTNAIASRAREQGYLVFELRANHLLRVLFQPSPPNSVFPALIYGKVMA